MSKNIYFLVFKLAYVFKKVNLLYSEILLKATFNKFNKHLLKATFNSLKVAFNNLETGFPNGFYYSYYNEVVLVAVLSIQIILFAFKIVSDGLADTPSVLFENVTPSR